jgi:enterochelin esterase-like enzyme
MTSRRVRAVAGVVLAALVLALAGAAGLAGDWWPRAARPEWPAGRVEDFTFASPSLPVPARSARVYLPPSWDREPARRYPVIYFLHGGPGWNGDWFTQGALRESLDALIGTGRIPELIAIAPDGHGPGRRGRSLWANSFDGRWRVEDFLLHDVIGWADSALRTLPDARDRALVGISDGGDAAVRLLLCHPDVFGACAGLSGRYRPHGPAGYEAIAGPPPGRDSVLRACAPLALPAGRVTRARGARIYFDAGVIDLAARDGLELHARLDRLGVPNESHVYAGWHDWPFWRRRYATALPFVTRGFATAAGSGSVRAVPAAAAQRVQHE